MQTLNQNLENKFNELYKIQYLIDTGIEIRKYERKANKLQKEIKRLQAKH